MAPMEERLMEQVRTALMEALEQRGLEPPTAGLSADTRLIGRGGLVDSLALVSLVIAVEQGIADEYNVAVTLADERAFSRSSSPFLTLGSLAAFAAERVREAQQTPA